MEKEKIIVGSTTMWAETLPSNVLLHAIDEYGHAWSLIDLDGAFIVSCVNACKGFKRKEDAIEYMKCFGWQFEGDEEEAIFDNQLDGYCLSKEEI